MHLFKYLKICLLAAYVAGSTLAKGKILPLFDEDLKRGRTMAAECVFDKHVRELGAVWIPDLGPPIGVLPCMRCKCVPYQKKRRIVARVQCSNIKDQCPVPSCDEPVVLPGRCCKTCPGDIKKFPAMEIPIEFRIKNSQT